MRWQHTSCAQCTVTCAEAHRPAAVLKCRLAILSHVFQPSLAGFEASKLNSMLDFMLNSRSGLGGSWEELAGSSCARCSGAIRFAHAPARRVKM